MCFIILKHKKLKNSSIRPFTTSLGMGEPISVNSSSFPEGWEKRVYQRSIGNTKGKWDVFILNQETGKTFRNKTDLQKFLDDRKLPYTTDSFDFSLDGNLKKLRQIWKQYKVKPFLKNPAALYRILHHLYLFVLTVVAFLNECSFNDFTLYVMYFKTFQR